MINLPLKLGKTQDCCGGQPLWGIPGDTSQDKIQLFLIVISVICIPLMLLVKPIYEIYCKNHSPPKFSRIPSSVSTDSKKLIESSEVLEFDKRDSELEEAEE